MLRDEQEELVQLVTAGRLSVCVNAPPQLGLWRVAGLWDEEPRHARQFPGSYGRLSTREACECLAEGSVTVYSLNLEPASLVRYSDDSQTVCTPLSSTAPDGIRFQASDLLVSQTEYERFVSTNPAINVPCESDASLGAQLRSIRKDSAAKPREDRSAREIERQRWRAKAAEIQAARKEPASKRLLAELVKQHLNLPDSFETIRKALSAG